VPVVLSVMFEFANDAVVIRSYGNIEPVGHGSYFISVTNPRFSLGPAPRSLA
jgi:hypothetical protein